MIETPSPGVRVALMITRSHSEREVPALQARNFSSNSRWNPRRQAFKIVSCRECGLYSGRSRGEFDQSH